MKKTFFKKLGLSLLCVSLIGCEGFFDKDNTPSPAALKNITQSAAPKRLWYSSVNTGTGKNYLKLIPAFSDNTIFTAGQSGMLTATDALTGKTIWQKSTNLPLSAGPTADNHLIFIATRTGLVIAIQQNTGEIVWKKQLFSEVLAPPAAANNTVLVKTIDGQLTALAEDDGHTLWHFQQAEPALILRGGSAPQIVNYDEAIVGFANGNLVKFHLKGGNLIWQQPIMMPQGSFAIQRMVDINADPTVIGNQIYVATYQGRLAAVNLSLGQINWTHDISSYTGLTADTKAIFVSDAKSNLWAFDKSTGAVKWQQTDLESRNITGPAAYLNTIIVGDNEGYLHWISQQDGHFVARTYVNSSGILATPLVKNNIIYVLTKDGHLAAYTLRS
jgi:outer membrane protein assembly factor BamB